MFFSNRQRKKIIKVSFISLAAIAASFVSAAETPVFAIPAVAKIVVEKNASGVGIIKGVVRDEQGSPISDAVVAIFRLGTTKLFKQVRSAGDGSFLARVIPGTYTVLAVAQGFNAMTIDEVQVNRSAEITYGIKLERAGSGNTLPEKRPDRESSKWRIRAAQNRRSIYQNQAGAPVIDENKTIAAQEKAPESIGIIAEDEDDKDTAQRRGQSIVETYFTNSNEGSYTGLNFATLRSLSKNTEIIIAGQTGIGNFAPGRFETTLKTRPNANHQIRLTASAAKLCVIKNTGKKLGQVSFQALDEWNTGSGVILVVGFDYSRFVGTGDASSISPRLGLQIDAGSKTRFRTAYTTQNEERTWSRAVELEDASVIFREQFAEPVIAVRDEKPLLNKSRRFEFGIERVLDNNSSLDATAFFDAVSGRGVGLVNLPLNVLNSEDFESFAVEQQGGAQGVRIIYTRRFGKVFSASAGYALGRGQKLSPKGFTNPAHVFENSLFQTFVGQLDTDLKTGTQVKTIFRLSPQATVFAIDPFQGRLAIYDPSLSILVTQSLPNWGLPIHAKAVLDARNILDFQTGVSSTEQGSLRLSSGGRIVRGGISLRF